MVPKLLIKCHFASGLKKGIAYSGTQLPRIIPRSRGRPRFSFWLVENGLSNSTHFPRLKKCRGSRSFDGIDSEADIFYRCLPHVFVNLLNKMTKTINSRFGLFSRRHFQTSKILCKQNKDEVLKRKEYLYFPLPNKSICGKTKIIFDHSCRKSFKNKQIMKVKIKQIGKENNENNKGASEQKETFSLISKSNKTNIISVEVKDPLKTDKGNEDIEMININKILGSVKNTNITDTNKNDLKSKLNFGEKTWMRHRLPKKLHILDIKPNSEEIETEEKSLKKIDEYENMIYSKYLGRPYIDEQTLKRITEAIRSQSKEVKTNQLSNQKSFRENHAIEMGQKVWEELTSFCEKARTAECGPKDEEDKEPEVPHVPTLNEFFGKYKNTCLINKPKKNSTERTPFESIKYRKTFREERRKAIKNRFGAYEKLRYVRTYKYRKSKVQKKDLDLYFGLCTLGEKLNYVEEQDKKQNDKNDIKSKYNKEILSSEFTNAIVEKRIEKGKEFYKIFPFSQTKIKLKNERSVSDEKLSFPNNNLNEGKENVHVFLYNSTEIASMLKCLEGNFTSMFDNFIKKESDPQVSEKSEFSQINENVVTNLENSVAEKTSKDLNLMKSDTSQLNLVLYNKLEADSLGKSRERLNENMTEKTKTGTSLICEKINENSDKKIDLCLSTTNLDEKQSVQNSDVRTGTNLSLTKSGTSDLNVLSYNKSKADSLRKNHVRLNEKMPKTTKIENSLLDDKISDNSDSKRESCLRPTLGENKYREVKDPLERGKPTFSTLYKFDTNAVDVNEKLKNNSVPTRSFEDSVGSDKNEDPAIFELNCLPKSFPTFDGLKNKFENGTDQQISHFQIVDSNENFDPKINEKKVSKNVFVQKILNNIFYIKDPSVRPKYLYRIKKRSNVKFCQKNNPKEETVDNSLKSNDHYICRKKIVTPNKSEEINIYNKITEDFDQKIDFFKLSPISTADEISGEPSPSSENYESNQISNAECECILVQGNNSSLPEKVNGQNDKKSINGNELVNLSLNVSGQNHMTISLPSKQPDKTPNVFFIKENIMNDNTVRKYYKNVKEKPLAHFDYKKIDDFCIDLDKRKYSNSENNQSLGPTDNNKLNNKEQSTLDEISPGKDSKEYTSHMFNNTDYQLIDNIIDSVDNYNKKLDTNSFVFKKTVKPSVQEITEEKNLLFSASNEKQKTEIPKINSNFPPSKEIRIRENVEVVKSVKRFPRTEKKPTDLISSKSSVSDLGKNFNKLSTAPTKDDVNITTLPKLNPRLTENDEDNSFLLTLRSKGLIQSAEPLAKKIRENFYDYPREIDIAPPQKRNPKNTVTEKPQKFDSILENSGSSLGKDFNFHVKNIPDQMAKITTLPKPIATNPLEAEAIKKLQTTIKVNHKKSKTKISPIEKTQNDSLNEFKQKIQKPRSSPKSSSIHFNTLMYSPSESESFSTNITLKGDFKETEPLKLLEIPENSLKNINNFVDEEKEDKKSQERKAQRIEFKGLINNVSETASISLALSYFENTKSDFLREQENIISIPKIEQKTEFQRRISNQTEMASIFQNMSDDLKKMEENFPKKLICVKRKIYNLNHSTEKADNLRQRTIKSGSDTDISPPVSKFEIDSRENLELHETEKAQKNEDIDNLDKYDVSSDFNILDKTLPDRTLLPPGMDKRNDKLKQNVRKLQSFDLEKNYGMTAPNKYSFKRQAHTADDLSQPELNVSPQNVIMKNVFHLKRNDSLVPSKVIDNVFESNQMIRENSDNTDTKSTVNKTNNDVFLLMSAKEEETTSEKTQTFNESSIDSSANQSVDLKSERQELPDSKPNYRGPWSFVFQKHTTYDSNKKSRISLSDQIRKDRSKTYGEIAKKFQMLGLYKRKKKEDRIVFTTPTEDSRVTKTRVRTTSFISDKYKNTPQGRRLQECFNNLGNKLTAGMKGKPSNALEKKNESFFMKKFGKFYPVTSPNKSTLSRNDSSGDS